jgi:hypothetical protein
MSAIFMIFLCGMGWGGPPSFASGYDTGYQWVQPARIATVVIRIPFVVCSEQDCTNARQPV